MKVYRRVWWMVAGLWALPGFVLALFWSVAGTLTVFGLGIAAGFMIAQPSAARAWAAPPSAGPPPAKGPSRPGVAADSFVTGIAAVAASGHLATTGWFALPVMILIAVASPPVLSRLHRRYIRPHPPSGDDPRRVDRTRRPPDAKHPPGSDESDEPRWWLAPRTKDPSRPAPPLPSNPPGCSIPAGPMGSRQFGPEPEGLDDRELCLAWRRSFRTLENATSDADRIEIVDLRQRYLDELQRRHPAHFHRWLGSGARAAGDPAKFLTADLNQAPPHQTPPHGQQPLPG